MNRKFAASLVLSTLILFTSNLFADDQAQNQAIANWVQKTLISTLSVNQNNPPAAELKSSYTSNAWQGITNFLSNVFEAADTDKLVLHPISNGNPEVVQAGIVENSHFFAGVQFWRVNQSILIPELSIRVDFSVVVVHTADNRYLIVAVNMQTSNE